MTAPSEGKDPTAAPDGQAAGGAPTDVRETARGLMRRGLSDEAIEAATGLDVLQILEIRAGASVADGAAPVRSPRPRSAPES